MISTIDLRKQKLLGDLNDSELDLIAKRMSVETHAKGAKIFGEGEPTKGICLVHKGKVEISKTTPDGWKQTLAVISTSQFFGELSVIEDRKAHSTNAHAIDATELYRITTDDFKELEKSQPAMMYKMMKTIARMAGRNVHSMNEKLMKALISY